MSRLSSPPWTLSSSTWQLLIRYGKIWLLLQRGLIQFSSDVFLLHRFSRWWAIFWQTWIRWVSQMHCSFNNSLSAKLFMVLILVPNHRWKAFHQSFRAKRRSNLGSVSCIVCLQVRNWQKTRRGNFCLIWSHLTTSSCQSCHSFRAADVHKTCCTLCWLYHREWCYWYFVVQNLASVSDMYVSDFMFVTAVQLHSGSIMYRMLLNPSFCSWNLMPNQGARAYCLLMLDTWLQQTRVCYVWAAGGQAKFRLT